MISPKRLHALPVQSPNISDINEFRLRQKKAFLTNETWCWINIPKCASKKINRAVTPGWREVSHDEAMELKTFAVIRDPHDRFISGIYEYKSRYKLTEPMEWFLLEWWKRPWHFDEHLIPQSKFIEGFDPLLVPINNIADVLIEHGIASPAQPMFKTIRRDPASKFDQLDDFYKSHRDRIDDIVQRDYSDDQDLWRLFIKSSKN